MSDEKYKVVFKGDVSDKVSVFDARKNFAAIFQADKKTLDKMFSGTRIALQRNTDLKTCREYVKKLEKSGILCVIEPEEEEEGVEKMKEKKPQEKKARSKKAKALKRRSNEISKLELLLLTLFLGWTGAHKFYLKKYIQGALCLIFIWTLIPLAVSLFEFIFHLCTSQKRLREKYQHKGSFEAVMVVAFLGSMFVIITATIAMSADANDITTSIKEAIDSIYILIYKIENFREKVKDTFKKHKPDPKEEGRGGGSGEILRVGPESLRYKHSIIYA